MDGGRINGGRETRGGLGRRVRPPWGRVALLTALVGLATAPGESRPEGRGRVAWRPGAPATVATPAARPATLGVTARSRTNYYVDNDGNTIVTPMVAVEAALNDQLSVSAHALVDVMTCASVDVISSATPKGYFQETRKEAGASLQWLRDLLRLTAGAVASRENDYSSATATLSAARDLAMRNVTLALSYAFTDSTVGRAKDWRFVEELDSHTLNFSYTQTLSPRWIAQLSVFGGALIGFLSSPYRMVRLTNGAWSEERAPRLRLRSAAALRLRGALGTRHFIGLYYRYYRDSWGIDSHAAELTWTWAPRRWVEVRLRNRVYTQDGAGFYKQRYSRPLRYMTSDRELGPFDGELAGLKLTFPLGQMGPLDDLAFDIKADVMWQWFDAFDALPMRRFIVTEAGLRVGF